MNGIRLFFKSAKGSVLSSLTLFVVLGAVLLTLNYTLSQYLYIRRAGEMFENAGLSGGLHFVNTTPYDAEGQEALDARNSNRCGKRRNEKADHKALGRRDDRRDRVPARAVRRRRLPRDVRRAP